MTTNSFTVAPNIPLSRLGREIEEALLQVIKIERLCLGDSEEGNSEQDDFTMAKKELYTLILNTKQMIRERAELLAAEGNSVDAIQKMSRINKNNEMMIPKFQFLKEAFKKESKRREKGEMDARFEELQIIKKQIEECKDLAKNAPAYPEHKVLQLTDFVKQMEESGAAPPAEFEGGGGEWREPTAEEQAVMARWAARDKEFDKRIFEIGEGVDKLTETAQGMGEKIAQQTRLAIDLSRQADEANQEVVKINQQLKSLVNSGTGLNLCCKLLLTIVLICLISKEFSFAITLLLIGFIVQNITNRVKGKIGGVTGGTSVRMPAMSDPIDLSYRARINLGAYLSPTL